MEESYRENVAQDKSGIRQTRFAGAIADSVDARWLL